MKLSCGIFFGILGFVMAIKFKAPSLGISADYIDSLFYITCNEQNSEYYSSITSNLQPPAKSRTLYNRKYGQNKKDDIRRVLKRLYGGLAKYQNVELENVLVKNVYGNVQDNKGFNNYENYENGTEDSQSNEAKEEVSTDDEQDKNVQFHKSRKDKLLDNNQKHDSNSKTEYFHYGKGNTVQNKANSKRFEPEGRSKRKFRKSK